MYSYCISIDNKFDLIRKIGFMGHTLINLQIATISLVVLSRQSYKRFITTRKVADISERITFAHRFWQRVSKRFVTAN